MKIECLTTEDMHEELAGTGEFPAEFDIIKCAYCAIDDSYLIEWIDLKSKRQHEKAVSDLDDENTARRSFKTYPDLKLAKAWFNDNDGDIICVCSCLDDNDAQLVIKNLKSENAKLELIPAV